jgi:type IV pilus secretin PilQ/predicted competence protein
VTSRKGVALKPLYVLFSLVLAGTLVAAAGPAGTEPGIVQLKAISARANGSGTSLVIEATGPTAYVTTRPDPFTVYVDFRNVGVGAVSNRFAADSKSPIAAVEVQTAESMGEPVSRVHIKLAQAVGYLVRSDRNRILVNFEKPSTASPSAAPPTSERRGDAMAALQNSAVKPDPTALLKSQTNPNSARAGGNSEPRRGVSEAAAGQQAPASQDSRAQVTEQIMAPHAERRFTGNPVSLDFQGADLRAVLRTFSEISSLNIVIDPAVQGTVDVALREVPWDQALDIILRANKLGYLIDGTIVRIAPLAVLADEEAQRRKLAEEQALAGELRLLTKTLSYARADELKDLLTKSALSPRGTVQVDPRTNTLIISDLGDRLQVASNLIITLDKAQPQVEIEARIVQTNKTFARALGVQWGFMGRVDPTLGNTTNLAFPNNGSLGGRVGGVQGPTPTDPATTTGTVPSAVNLGAQAATSGVGLALGSINRSFNLDVALTALERSGNGRLLSTPRVSTQNNIEAEIAQGVQIPYQTVSNNTVTTQFKDAALTLKVTPQITASDTVIMKISVDNGSVGEVLPGGVSINTQRANTTVQVDDGQTTVIGGIYASQEVTANDKTPGLGNIPLLKWLFKRDVFDDKSSELLIFITPRIIK